MDFREKKRREINRYRGIVVNVRVDEVELADGRRSFREVVEHPGGVCVLPVDEEGYAFCVRQYRYPPAEHLLEAPAGKLEPGEEPLACAVRELSEETGFTAGKLIPLGGYYTSPGFSTERLYLYLATELRKGEAHPDEGELLETVRIPLKELAGKALQGESPDGKTAIAVLQAWERLRDSFG